MKFHHIGFACKNIEKEIRMHEKLGYVVTSPVFFDNKQNIKCVFLTNNGFCIELIEGLGDASPIKNYLQKNIQMYHQAFTVSNIETTIQKLVEEGAIEVVPPVEAVAFNNNKIAFVYLRNKLLVELIEEVK